MSLCLCSNRSGLPMPKPIGITALFFGRCNFDFVGSHELRELVSSVQVIDIFFELSVVWNIQSVWQRVLENDGGVWKLLVTRARQPGRQRDLQWCRVMAMAYLPGDRFQLRKWPFMASSLASIVWHDEGYRCYVACWRYAGQVGSKSSRSGYGWKSVWFTEQLSRFGPRAAAWLLENEMSRTSRYLKHLHRHGCV